MLHVTGLISTNSAHVDHSQTLNIDTTMPDYWYKRVRWTGPVSRRCVENFVGKCSRSAKASQARVCITIHHGCHALSASKAHTRACSGWGVKSNLTVQTCGFRRSCKSDCVPMFCTFPLSAPFILPDPSPAHCSHLRDRATLQPAQAASLETATTVPLLNI